MHEHESCLVLEGGALRGVYTSGALLTLKRLGLQVDCVMGISAGSLNGLSWLSDQLERAARINTAMVDDPDYVGARPLLYQRSVINFPFLFDGKADCLEPFDFTAAENSPLRFVTGATRASDGQLQIFEKGHCSLRSVVQASASLPGLTPGIEIDGIHYFDGAISDPLLLSKAIQDGYGKIILILTQKEDLDQRGSYSPTALRLMRIRMRNYPAIYQQLLHSEALYGDLGRYVRELERAGRIHVIRPSEYVPISLREHSPALMQRILNLGEMDAQQDRARLSTYLQA